jgi:molybdopterin synthase catalytic subunit
MAMKLHFSLPSAEVEMLCLVREPIEVCLLRNSMVRPEDGAIAIFEGIVRNQSRGKHVRYLEYDAYEAMAQRKLEEIGEQARQQFAIRAIGIIHRLGRLQHGECSVAIVVTSLHRAAAFEACRFAIDSLKKNVPIWKKEVYEDGEIWIEGEH